MGFVYFDDEIVLCKVFEDYFDGIIDVYEILYCLNYCFGDYCWVVVWGCVVECDESGGVMCVVGIL